MVSPSQEQRAYIEYRGDKHTKLIACAGSGKTFCIIQRLIYVVKKKIYQPSEVLVLTFSKFTQTDFVRKLERSGQSKIPLDQIRTIDSFAKEIIDADGRSTDVDLLSITLMKHLEATPRKELKKHLRLKSIKTVFVDEAQDLNPTQFAIIDLFRKKLKWQINLIGDPNQNIYQFRDSSDKYLRDFAADSFYLTTNYRSYEPNVRFSEHLRPYRETTITAHRKIEREDKYDRNRPMIYQHLNDQMIGDQLLMIITGLMKTGVDGSRIAILAPTRGYVKNERNKMSKGLCFVANLLMREGIGFSQFYDEATDAEGERTEYRPESGSINLLTYTGSKGLEWDYVILLNCDFGLTNRFLLDEERHRYDQYLLYVAATRAIRRMYIFSTSFARGKKPMTSPWLGRVPAQMYRFPGRLEVAEVSFEKKPMVDSGGVTTLLRRLRDYELYEIEKMLTFSDEKIEQIYPERFDRLKSEGAQASLLGRLTERMFIYQYFRRDPNKIPRIDLIEDLVEERVIECGEFSVINWYRSNRQLTWTAYDRLKKSGRIPKSITKVIDRKLSREREFGRNTLVNSSFFAAAVDRKYPEIEKAYQVYRSGVSWRKALSSIFYLTVVEHAIITQHYFHILTEGARFVGLKKSYRPMFRAIGRWVTTLPKNRFTDYHRQLSGMGLVGEVDLEGEDGFHEIKCTKAITLKHKLQLLLYNYLDSPTGTELSYPISVLNFLTGEWYRGRVELKPESMAKIVELLQFHGRIELPTTSPVQDSPIEEPVAIVPVFTECAF